ncbi:MAG: hypothetical protein JXR25_03115 [Pontiellaceae bacterium]|nr:hypothetical protein [Pontiellaceae bacterium]
MGGGSKQVSSNSSSDNDIMAAEGATVIGDNGSFVDYSVEAGIGSTVIGEGATAVDTNTGSIFGDGADVNSGIQLGIGATYTNTSMDENTRSLIDNALQLMYANTENVLDAHSADSQLAASLPIFQQQPTVVTTENAADEGQGSKVVNYGLGLGALALIALALKGRSNK